MSVAAGVLHYRNFEGLRPTLDTLLAQSRRPEHLIVVDHGSGDGSTERIRDAYPEFEIVEIAVNRGPTAGLNHVLRATLATGADALAIVTDDVRLAPDVLELLVARLEADSALGGVCPLNLYPGAEGQTMVHHGGYIDRRTWHLLFSGEPGDGVEWIDRPPHRVDWIEAGSEMFRASAVREVGLLNEDFYHRDGETELCIRMRSRGWQFECVPAAVVHAHFGRDSTYMNTRNQLEIVRRHAPTKFFIRGLIRTLYLVARDVVSPRRRPTRDTWLRLRGLIDFARGHWGPPPKTVTRVQS